jgi:hypothetical protein
VDHSTADQLGRELAWVQARNAGIVSDEMCKQAGLIEGLLFAPLTAIAAFLSAPMGSKLHSLGVGALLGAGIGAFSDREVENRNEKGDPVKHKDLSPLMKTILTGLAIGGTERVRKSVEEGKPISRMGAILTGAPMGALISGSNPATGMAVGAISGSLLSALGAGGKLPGPLQIFGGQPQQGMQAQAPSGSSFGMASQPAKSEEAKPQQSLLKLMDFGAVKAPTAAGSFLPQGVRIAPPEAAKKLLS